MEEYGIRIGQLKRLKASIITKLILLYSFLPIICYVLYKIFCLYYDVEHLSFNKKYILYFIIEVLFIVSYLSLSVFYTIYSNKRFNRFYLDCIYSECKLIEIYLLEHKAKNFRQINSFLNKAFNLNYIHFLSSYSDASNKFSLDISKVRYIYHKKKSNGTLLSIHYDQEKPGFLQISPYNKCNFEKYDNKDVIQYGMSKKSFLNQYHIFSTYQSKTYIFENNEYAKKIIVLEKYFLDKINLVFDNDNLYIFIPNYVLNLTDSIIYPISNNRFNEKIDSIKEMHQLMFDVIKMFDELFID